MSKRFPKARYVLPETVNPTSHVCYQIEVPNDKFHIAAFLGQIYALGGAYIWANDENHTAKDVAAVWRNIYLNMVQGCSMQTLLRMSGDCAWIEYSLDNGVSWEQLVNISACANAAITEAIEDGVITVPGQQEPGGEVTLNECWSYNVQLNGNGIWHCPVPISGGYTITITPAKGGWWDGDINDLIWSCPTGSDYAFGECVGSPEPAQEGDPLQTAPHMRIIGHYGDTYFDAYDAEHEVTGEQTQADFYLQANDGDISDNQGSVNCKVTICNYSQWCYEWNFTVNQQGWSAEYGTTYESGVGFNDGNSPDGAYIYKLELPEYTSEKVEVEFNETWNGDNPTVFATDVYPVESYKLSSTAQGSTVITLTGELSGTVLYIAADRKIGNVQHFGTIRLTKVRLFGSGTNPFGEDNC